MVQYTKQNNGTFIISQLNFNIEIGIFEIFILRLQHEKKISTVTSKKNSICTIWPIRWEKTNLEKRS